MPRTEGVSTTDLVGRMLLMTREHLTPSTAREAKAESSVKEYALGAKNSPYTGVSKFVPTTRKIVEFSANRRDPKVRRLAVVISALTLGSPAKRWSTLTVASICSVCTCARLATHTSCVDVGHIDILKLAKDQGGYLIVGVYDDKVRMRVRVYS